LKIPQGFFQIKHRATRLEVPYSHLVFSPHTQKVAIPSPCQRNHILFWQCFNPFSGGAIPDLHRASYGAGGDAFAIGRNGHTSYGVAMAAQCYPLISFAPFPEIKPFEAAPVLFSREWQ